METKHLPEIFYRTIEHKHQKYETVGDYYTVFHKGLEKNGMNFRVSKTRFEYELAIFVHELVEWGFCNQAGIKIEGIDAFDIEFEKARKEKIKRIKKDRKGAPKRHINWLIGLINQEEPGDDPRAPYFIQHQFATIIEKMIIEKFGLDWKEYEEVLNSLK